MNVGDLVRNLNSEARCAGIVVGFEFTQSCGGFSPIRMPVVLWGDGRCSRIMPDMVVRYQ